MTKVQAAFIICLIFRALRTDIIRVWSVVYLVKGLSGASVQICAGSTLSVHIYDPWGRAKFIIMNFSFVPQDEAHEYASPKLRSISLELTFPLLDVSKPTGSVDPIDPNEQ